jgi:hypothetical protein
VAQYFEYSALFVVHGDLAEGRDAYGPGTDRSRISTIGVPLDLPSVLATARDSGMWHLARLGSSTLDQALARDLRRQPEGLVFVMPINVRSRCVMLFYGDQGDSDVDPSRLDDVISFVPDLSAALERILLERKRGRLSAIPTAAHDRGQPPPGSAELSEPGAAAPEPEAQPPSPRSDDGSREVVATETPSPETAWAQATPLPHPLTPAPEIVYIAGP